MGKIYHDAEQFETLFRRLFTQIEEDNADLMTPLVESRMIVCFEIHDPAVQMWVDGRSAPVETSFGASALDATLTARVSGDHFHEILLGTLPLGRALWQRKLQVKGPKLKARKLESLLHACQADYPDLANELPGR
jgi:putative sterol carrier protein